MKGELDATKKRLAELEAKCKTDFECSLTELPALVKQLEAEAETSLNKAETTLGMRGKPVPTASESDEEFEDKDALA